MTDGAAGGGQPPQSAAAALRAMIVPVTAFRQNCTLLWNDVTKAGAVVDPGGDLDVIQQAIAESGMKPQTILLTHGHIDHAAGADELRERLAIPVVGPHLADKLLLDGLAAQGAAYGIAGARPVTPDRWLDQGDVVEAAGLTFDILHCPGHSPGSVVFAAREVRLALVGDVLFQGSIGRTDFPYGDHEALITSIKTKLLPLGDDVIFICGHGPRGRLGEERLTNPFLV